MIRDNAPLEATEVVAKLRERGHGRLLRMISSSPGAVKSNGTVNVSFLCRKFKLKRSRAVKMIEAARQSVRVT